MAKKPKHLKLSPEFPKLRKNNNDVASCESPLYNCIAFAAGETTRKWWPSFHPDAYWPPNVSKSETIDAFVEAFETLGYAKTDTDVFDPGKDKIAIYARNGVPKHAAIQKDRRKWMSKLGDWYDIEHSKDAVSGGEYGEIAVIMERSKRQ